MAVHNAPLRDPIYYKILDYNVSLRHCDAERIEVRLLEPFEEQTDTVDAPQELLPDPELHSLHRMELGHIKTRELPTLRIALLGNPNCGKTSLFNQASGAHEHVGNYSGVTIEAKSGYIYYGGSVSSSSTYQAPTPSPLIAPKRSTSATILRVRSAQIWCSTS